MVFGHNLHYMAPFGIPRPGFCMIFQRASSFHARGRIIQPGIRFGDLGSTFWPGDLFWVNTWVLEKLICDGIILAWQFRGNPQTQMNSIIYRTHLGRLLCPKPSLFNYFQGISRFSGKLGGPWDLPCVFPIPLRATVALFPLFGVSRWCVPDLAWHGKWLRRHRPTP